MDDKNLEKRAENREETSINAPAVESFLDPARVAEVWPEEVTKSEGFLEQVGKRRELVENLNEVFGRLPRPDISFQAATEGGLVTEDQVKKAYDSLTELLGSGHDYDRIILYLPFEMLPDKKWKPGEELGESADNFRKTYMKAWHGLLQTHDVRANFVDGDVLEIDRRKEDLPRVVKAAHLIPKLVEKGLIDARDAIRLMKDSTDEVLKHSIADTLPVLVDMSLLDKKDFDVMKKSDDNLVRGMAKIIESQKKEKTDKKETEPITYLSVQKRLAKKFNEIDSDDYGDATKKRKEWLIKKRKQEAVENVGEKIGQDIVGQKLDSSETENFLSEKANPETQQALIEGIRKAVESTAASSPEQ
ncbi:MAG: hypothetical protein ABSA74_00620, partial [Candidatus Staskawiczbacteria bacterium]